jgi:hypothetical protein
MSDRGSGRTARQLAALPDGAVYLVHSQQLADYCKGILRSAGRRISTVTFATPGNFRSFEGARFTALDVDHAYFELASARGREAYDFLRLTVLHNG